MAGEKQRDYILMVVKVQNETHCGAIRKALRPVSSGKGSSFFTVRSGNYLLF